MPSIDNSYPRANSNVGSPFDTGGSLSLSFEDGQPTARLADMPYVECWIEKNGTPVKNAATTMTNSSWHGIFTGVPDGSGYTIKAKLHTGGTAYDANDVSGVTVQSAPSGFVTPDSGNPALRVAADEKGAAKTERAGPRLIHVHHRISVPILPSWLLSLRSISAAFIDTNGVQRTRVFDGTVDPHDGEFAIDMNLARVAGMTGSIKARAELWPDIVLPWLILPNVIVMDR